jgi:hypothetical protein
VAFPCRTETRGLGKVNQKGGYQVNDPDKPKECEICGEPLFENSEIGEFVSVIGENQEHVIAHVQCGLDANLETA